MSLYDDLLRQGLDPSEYGITPDTPDVAPSAPGDPTPPPTQPPTAPPTTTPTDRDALARDALSTLRQTLSDWGFSDNEQASLGTWMWGELTAGASETQVSLDVYQRPEFQARFPAIFERQRAGLPAISPGNYVQLETQFHQVAAGSDLPPGFYDSRDDFHNLIARDWTPGEFHDVITQGFSLVNDHAPAAVRDYFSRAYGVQGDGALAALFLDSDKAIPLLEQMARAAQIGGRAATTGFNLSTGTAEQFAGQGVTDFALNSGLSQVQNERGLLRGTVSEGTNISDEDAVKAALGFSAAAAEDLRRRQAERVADFAGGGGSVRTQQGFAGLGAAESDQ